MLMVVMVVVVVKGCHPSDIRLRWAAILPKVQLTSPHTLRLRGRGEVPESALYCSPPPPPPPSWCVRPVRIENPPGDQITQPDFGN